MPTLDPHDLRLDIIRVAGGEPCPVRAIHLPTGTSVTVDDGSTIAENRARALQRLADHLGLDLP